MRMRCIRCGTDNNLRARTTNYGRCKNCNHPFAFEPSAVPNTLLRFTDPFFARAIDELSVNDTLFFTPKQLFYSLDRRLKSRDKLRYDWIKNYFFISIYGSIFINVILSGINNIGLFEGWLITNLGFILRYFYLSGSGRFNFKVRILNAIKLQIIGIFLLIIGSYIGLVKWRVFNLYVTVVGLGTLSIFLGTWQRIRQAKITEEFLFEQNKFQEWLNRWIAINGSITKMLASPREENNVVAISSDVSAYSFDRVVVCDSAEIAQLLIANNFHVENNCAILSITGYPQSIFATVMEMLRRNPELKVYALHDASPRGVGLVHHLHNNPNWFQNSNAVIFDLGLSIKQILRSRNLMIRSSELSARESMQLPEAVRQELSQNELKWLDSGKFVELESFTPERIIRVLQQGIAQSQEPGGSSMVILNDGSNDAGMIFVADSFG